MIVRPGWTCASPEGCPYPCTGYDPGVHCFVKMFHVKHFKYNMEG